MRPVLLLSIFLAGCQAGAMSDDEAALGLPDPGDGSTGPLSAPGAPQVTLSNGSWTNLTWTCSDNADRYGVYHRVDGIDTTFVVEDATTECKYHSTNVHPGVRNCYQVVARNLDHSAWSPISCYIPPPHAPTLTLGSVTRYEIVLKMVDNSTNENHFTLFRRDGSGAWTQLFGAAAYAGTGTIVGFHDSNITLGHHYSYKATVYDADGRAADSVTVQADAYPALPAAPPPLAYDELDRDQLRVHWIYFGSGEDAFDVCWRPSGGAESCKQEAVGTGHLSTLLTRLAAGTAYSIRVGARNTTGTAWSDWLAVTTWPAGRPSPQFEDDVDVAFRNGSAGVDGTAARVTGDACVVQAQDYGSFGGSVTVTIDDAFNAIFAAPQQFDKRVLGGDCNSVNAQFTLSVPLTSGLHTFHAHTYAQSPYRELWDPDNERRFVVYVP
jgi:hypothetical protein